MSNQMPKGLKQLLDENVFEQTSEEIVELPLSDIKPNPYQPRTIFNRESINDLAKSIAEHGVIQPIIVKQMNGYYAIIAGERRYRASLKLGLETIPAIIRPYEKAKMIELALIENLQREDLSPTEEANAYVAMMRELDYNQTEVAKKVGKSRSYVTNVVGILSLPAEVLAMLDLKKISFGHARALSKLLDKARMLELANEIVDKNLSVRQIEEIVKNEDKRVVQKKKKKQATSTTYETYVKDRFGIKIKVDGKKIIIKPKSQKDFDELVELLLEEIK